MKFSIVSRGTMIIQYKGKTLKVSGELTFTPPIFYADVNSISKWEPPNDKEKVSEKEKEEIISHISKESQKEGMTKVFFD